MMETDSLLSNLQTLRTRISIACERAGRNPDTVELLPVTKGHPAEKIRALYDLGFRRFGENYVQEMEKKAHQLGTLAGIQWVFLGRVQSNKINNLVMVCDEIQALEQLSHAARLAKATQKPIQIYIAVNCGLELHKSGVPLAQVESFARELQLYPQLDLQGLFAVPPEIVDSQLRHQLYTQLATLACTIGKGRLSLGMSQDVEAAVEAGSTLVRVGTALLGPHEGKTP